MNNKAAYLMVDGGAFNGKTVTGIGLTKTIKIYYEVQRNLLTSGSDYEDLYNALQTACSNLTGTSGITVSDCQEVKDAVDAVEMNLQPSLCDAPEAPLCPANQVPTYLFQDGFEAGLGNWTNVELDNQTNPFVAIWELTTGYAKSGIYSAWGWNSNVISDAYIAKTTPITLPAGAYLRFDHSFFFEYDFFDFYDGGVLEYSTTGGDPWNDLGPYITDNGYNGTIASSWGNPLYSRLAFVGSSNGYISSRVNLSTFAGQNFTFRFRVGSDSMFSYYGWFIDNVKVYTCATPTVSVTVTTSPAGRQITVDSDTYTAPQTFIWDQGSSHTIAVTTTQSGGAAGTQYVYSSWSDGGAASHSVTAPSVATTYTANFTTQYQLTTSVSPVSSGTVSPNCPSGCWYNSGATASLTPTPSGGYDFLIWSGDVNSYDSPLQLTMNGPGNVVANFTASTPVTDLVRIAGTTPAYYSDINAAYAAASSGNVIQIRAGTYGPLTTNRVGVSPVTFIGGYNSTFGANTGVTAVTAPLVVQYGTVVINNLTVQ